MKWTTGWFYSAFIIETKHMETLTLIRESRWLHLKAIFCNMDCFILCVCGQQCSRVDNQLTATVKWTSGRQGVLVQPRPADNNYFNCCPKACWVSGKLKNWSAVEETHEESGESWEPKKKSANTAESLMMLVGLFLWLIFFFWKQC